VVDAADERFNMLINDVLPQLADVSGLLLFVPNYFDFIRIRNHLKSKDFNFVQICEYSKVSLCQFILKKNSLFPYLQFNRNSSSV